MINARSVLISLCVFVSQGVHVGNNNSQAQLPFEKAPVFYSKSTPADPVAKLNKKLESGEVSLSHDRESGYLKSLLSELDIPVTSQTLVFAKNSLQRLKISPSNPRAIYFNDETYLGYVPQGDLIEIASTDPMLGTVFYTIDQRLDDQPVSSRKQLSSRKPVLSRKTEQCLFCHASTHTGRVPGLMMQSVFTDRNGYRVFPQESIFPKASGPLDARLAGWFVTGQHGDQRHLGNLMIDSSDIVTAESELSNRNISDLSKWFDPEKYLSPHSDLVALLVLQHQVTIHNLLTGANHEARRLLFTLQRGDQEGGQDDDSQARSIDEETAVALDLIAQEVVDGMLMVMPMKLASPVSGSSLFAKEFVAKGPSDSQGRSLRSLDLQTTLFRYPCSYLIYSESFDALPDPLRQRVYRRMVDVLLSRDTREKYSHLDPVKRTAVLQILISTKDGFPDVDQDRAIP